MRTHHTLGEYSNMELFAIMISFHSSTSSFNILAIVQQHLVQLIIFHRNGLPVPEETDQQRKTSNSQQLRYWIHPSMNLPSNVTNWILNESEEIFEHSSLVALIRWLLCQSELLEFPIVLLSHRSVIMRFHTCRCTRVFQLHWGHGRTCRSIRDF